MKCINKGPFKNLTEGKDYPVLKDDGDYIIVNNDLGLESRYSKKYFEGGKSKREVPKTRPAPPPPPPPPPIPEISVPTVSMPEVDEFESSDETIVLVVSGTVAGSTQEVRRTVSGNVKNTSGSCGVFDYSGVDDLFNTILGVLTLLNPRRTDQEILPIAIRLFQSSIRDILDSMSAAFVLFSTSIDRAEVTMVLNEICNTNPGSVSTPATINPNSGNNIVVWVIATGQTRDDEYDDDDVEED